MPGTGVYHDADRKSGGEMVFRHNGYMELEVGVNRSERFVP